MLRLGIGCLIFLLSVVAVQARERHALVIGVDRYDRARNLANAGHDARAVAARLGQLDFSLFGGRAHLNPDRQSMLTLMRDFASALPDGALAVVYLAGHGVAHNGGTYLIPSNDQAIVGRSNLDEHGVALSFLTARLAARRQVDGWVLVDACSANGLRGEATTGVMSDLVAPSSGSLSLVYAAAPGQIAADGDGRHSPFAQALLDAALAQPHQRIDQLFYAISANVRNGTQGRQTPWSAQALSLNGGDGLPPYFMAPERIVLGQ